MGLFTPLIGRLMGNKRPDLEGIEPEIADPLMQAPTFPQGFPPAPPPRPTGGFAGTFNAGQGGSPSPAASGGGRSGLPPPPPDNPFQTVIDALREGLTDFASKQLQTDLYINPRYCFEITRIELRPLTPQADSSLQNMLSRYPAAHLAGFMQRNIFAGLPNGRHIDTHGFEGIYRLPPHPPAPPTTALDLDDEALAFDAIRAELDAGACSQQIGSNPHFEFYLHGRLVELPAERSAVTSPVEAGRRQRTTDGTVTASESAPPPAVTATTATAAQTWQVADANGVRESLLAPVPATTPLLLGKDPAHGTLTLAGTFVSSLHGRLWFEQGGWWYQDAGSTNGSRIDAPDGSCHVFPARSARLPAAGQEAPPPHEAVPLSPGCRIVCGTTVPAEGNEQTAANYPWLQCPVAAVAGRETGREDNRRAAATPLTNQPAAAVMQPVAVLLVRESHDPDRPRRVPLTEAALPFRIGRSGQQSLTVPDQHRSVSGEHLVIDSIHETGAQIQILGKNGVQSGTTIWKQGEVATWPWGQDVLLGRSTENIEAREPPYLLTLERPQS